MVDARRQQMAARVRAAGAYADLKQPEIAKAMGFSTRTWARIEAGNRPADDIDFEKFAELCHVPVAFLRQGFEMAPVATLDSNAARLERILRELLQHRQRVEDALAGRVEAHKQLVAKVDDLSRLGHRVEQLLNPSPGDQWDETQRALDADLRSEQQEPETSETERRDAQGGSAQ